MVRFLPAAEDKRWNRGEQAFLPAIAALDDSWTCLHHCDYKVPRRAQRRHGQNGEVDILLAHLDYGFFTIEVKAGMYVWDQRGLRTPSGRVIEPTPRQQGMKAKEAALEFAKDPDIFIPWEVLAGFPDMDPVRPFGPPGYDEDILWRSHLRSVDQLRAHLVGLVERPWSGAVDRRRAALSKICDWLCPPGRVPSLSQQMRHASEGIERETAEMLRWTEDQLRHAAAQDLHRLTFTSGPAGTGKSLLASDRARRLARLGYRVLFFTPNTKQQSELVELFQSESILAGGNRIEATEPSKIVVRALEYVARTGGQLAEASARLATEALSWPARFDALIIDEAQDLTEDLFTALQLLLDETSGAPEVHAFGDEHQSTGVPGAWHADRTFWQMFLTRPCRCSTQIQTIVNRVVSAPTTLHEIDGPDPEFVELDPKVPADQVLKRLGHYLNQDGLRPAQVQILVGVEPDGQWERDTTSALRAGLMRMKPSPRLPLTADAFKGCEADAILFVTDATEPTQEVRRELYVALSRARSHLTIVARRTLLDWLSTDHLQPG